VQEALARSLTEGVSLGMHAIAGAHCLTALQSERGGCWLRSGADSELFLGCCMRQLPPR
jgi:hypothetical protein